MAYHLIKNKFSSSQRQNSSQVCFSITEKVIYEFSRYVVLDEKPFVMGESQAFDQFVHSSQQLAYHLISRGAFKKMINSWFTNTNTKLLNYLTAFKGRVSVTCDLWRSPFQGNFLRVVCHWIYGK